MRYFMLKICGNMNRIYVTIAMTSLLWFLHYELIRVQPLQLSVFIALWGY